MEESIPFGAQRGEEALVIEGCLQRLGLTGPKLAVSFGTEEELTGNW
jgi:hypothetical protein